MKKIDLHIHTVPTISDADFTFSLDVFKRYVEESRLDAVAVTNHNVFDLEQFRTIQDSLAAIVFPGIEIDVAKGHLLVIACPSRLGDFEAKSSIVAERITQPGDDLSVAQLISVFGDLHEYLLIPHLDKSPPIRGEALEQLRPFICSGEVDSAKKFVRALKDESKPTPVFFSDARMKADLDRLPTRQTFIDCGTLTIDALRACLRDKTKVKLSERDGNNLWQVLENGLRISTGLNVLIGARSSGKTHTLDEISEAVENSKYIRQFSLVQQSDADFDRAFTSDVERRRSNFVDEYLSGLRRILDEVMSIDLKAGNLAVERYLSTLLASAEETDRQDAFSKAVLFGEVPFPLGDDKTLTSLIESVRQVVANREFRDVIERHVDLDSLKSLAIELIETLWARRLDREKKRLVNELVEDVKKGLRVRTSATQVEDVDLYHFCLDRCRVDRFCDIVEALKREKIIFREELQGFRVEARRGPYSGAGEIKKASGTKTAFKDAFGVYGDPYAYLCALCENEDLGRGDLYKLFIKVTYVVRNKDGVEVSGGERSEYRLLQEISDAQNFDLLLIDEPESSFDNLFLKSDVNQLLKGISATMPVVVVTHNSTVGASVGADYVLYTKKEFDDERRVVYRIYSGYPTDKSLASLDGREVGSHEIVMDALEAGAVAYESRRQGYEAIKD